MTNQVFQTRSEAVKAGYFSRRHQDGRAHQEAGTRWRRKKSKVAKRSAAAVMRAERDGRSDGEQLALIAKRPGFSRRETDRLCRRPNP